MNHTAKIDPAPSDAMDDDVMSETENIEATGVLEYRPNPNYVADSEALDDELSFVLGEG